MNIKGKVYKILSNFYYVKQIDDKTKNILNDNVFECKARGRFKNDEIDIFVGDNTEIELNEKEIGKGNIVKVLERKNYCIRPSVANLDKLIIILSIKDPKPDYLLLDKQIIYCIKNNIEPVICVNKIDKDKDKGYLKIKEIYEKIGYHVYNISAKENIGIDELKNELKNNICVFCGNSGVGKSTLINCICNEKLTIEGNISNKSLKGKHTTKHVEIFNIDDIYIVDTPGFSIFEIQDIDKKELWRYFEEFNKYAYECEYRDCIHIKEKKCGIKKAIEDKEISEERYNRYIEIYDSLINGGR